MSCTNQQGSQRDGGSFDFSVSDVPASFTTVTIIHSRGNHKLCVVPDHNANIRINCISDLQKPMFHGNYLKCTGNLVTSIGRKIPVTVKTEEKSI